MADILAYIREKYLEEKESCGASKEIDAADKATQELLAAMFAAGFKHGIEWTLANAGKGK